MAETSSTYLIQMCLCLLLVLRSSVPSTISWDYLSMFPHWPKILQLPTLWCFWLKKALTICVNPHGRGCDVGGDGKVGEPQVLWGRQGSEDTSSHIVPCPSRDK